jgi:hypothetical protein
MGCLYRPIAGPRVGIGKLALPGFDNEWLRKIKSWNASHRGTEHRPIFWPQPHGPRVASRGYSGAARSSSLLFPD